MREGWGCRYIYIPAGNNIVLAWINGKASCNVMSNMKIIAFFNIIFPIQIQMCITRDIICVSTHIYSCIWYYWVKYQERLEYIFSYFLVLCPILSSDFNSLKIEHPQNSISREISQHWTFLLVINYLFIRNVFTFLWWILWSFKQ